MTELIGLASGVLFPEVDPIPLPAPVWLFKVLHNLTLALHFSAIHLLLGGLLVSVIVNWLGQRSRQPAMIEASGAMAGWLPIVMIYVINLGVPPLLFAQVLYGRALYTSSVLIGMSWLAVIPLLIACYQLLYGMQGRARRGESWWGFGLIALILAWIIAMIYSTNMTLMLHPETWREIYRSRPSGTSFHISGLGWLPRWLYMVTAGLVAAAVMMSWLSRSSTLSEDARRLLIRLAGQIGLGGTLACLATGLGTWFSQPESIRSACAANFLGLGAITAWFPAVAGIGICSVLLLRRPILRWPLFALFSVVAFLQVATAIICRDGIRDALLGEAGFDVWKREVFVNWSVLILFFALLVAGLGIVGWLSSVAWRVSASKGETE